MSRLKVHWPNSQSTIINTEPEEPRILSFVWHSARVRHRQVVAPDVSDVVARARALHLNRSCPYCSHPIVQPIELRDSVMNRNQMPIPGTATLVGFRCECCQAEWSANNE